MTASRSRPVLARTRSSIIELALRQADNSDDWDARRSTESYLEVAAREPTLTDTEPVEIARFLDLRAAEIAVSVLAKHQWMFGETTDDTERTIAVARAVLRDGEVRHISVGRELLTCKKSVHPGVRSFGHSTKRPTRHESRSITTGVVLRYASPRSAYCTAQTAWRKSLKGRIKLHLDPWRRLSARGGGGYCGGRICRD